MKSIRMLIVITLVATILFLCIGAVSAQSSNAASVTVLWTTLPPIRAGETATAVVTFTSNRADQIVITRVGFHFDWMEANQFYTSDLSANPVTVPANGVQAFNPLSIQIPPYVTAGSHNYYVAIDGEQGFAWDSETKTVDISASGSGSTGVPTSTPTSGAGGQDGGIPLNYLAIAATAIIVVVALVVVVMWTRRKKPESAAPVIAGQSDSAKPEEKPAEQKPEASEDKSESSEYSI